MLIVFAYTCNLRTNLVNRPTETPIDTYQVKNFDLHKLLRMYNFDFFEKQFYLTILRTMYIL
jgi:hypothetical protein